MLNFLEWIDTKQYWVRDTWSDEKKRMIGEGPLHLFPIQRRILGHALTFTEEGLLPYETVLYSCVKKSGKTAIAAAVGAWYAEEGPAGSEIYVIANDLEQAASRVFRDLAFHFKKRNEHHKGKGNFCKITEYRIDFPNGTFIQVLSQSYRSVAGSRHALTLWDELWGVVSEANRRTWDEMTPIPTVANSLRFISTYAGFENESELLWEMYMRGVGPTEHENGQGAPIPELEDITEAGDPTCWKSGKMFTYWSHEGHMPWQTDSYYDEQRSSERPAAFMRLHMNQWVTSHEEFLPVAWWDFAARSYKENALKWSDHPFRYWPVTIGIDAGIKRDSTALVAVGYDSNRAKLGIVYHKIWTPSEGDQINLDETVEKELIYLYNKFKVASIVYDPTHLMQTMLRLQSKGFPTHQFDQTLSNMTSASQLLYELLKARNLEAYPADDLRSHIQMSVAETTSRGFRIVKNKQQKKQKVDGAIALAMAAYAAVQSGGVDISIPVQIRSPYSDMTAWDDQKEQGIPFELQSD